MTAPANCFRTVAFGDVEGRLWGVVVEAGQWVAVVGAAGERRAITGVTVSAEGRAWRVTGDGLDLRVEPYGETPAPTADGGPPDVSGVQELCHVRGTVGIADADHGVDGPGTRSEVDGLPDGSLASARAISGWFGDDEALTLVALRPHGDAHHDADLVAATLFDPEGWVWVDDPRLSTTYTEAGGPARMSLELWVAEEDGEYPRRAAGEISGPAEVMRGDGLALQVVPMRCHSRGRDGAGVYVLAEL